jgi:hypothetical protein
LMLALPMAFLKIVLTSVAAAVVHGIVQDQAQGLTAVFTR